MLASTATSAPAGSSSTNRATSIRGRRVWEVGETTTRGSVRLASKIRVTRWPTSELLTCQVVAMVAPCLPVRCLSRLPPAGLPGAWSEGAHAVMVRSGQLSVTFLKHDGDA